MSESSDSGSSPEEVSRYGSINASPSVRPLPHSASAAASASASASSYFDGTTPLSSGQGTPESDSEATPMLASPSTGSLLHHPIENPGHKRKSSWSSVVTGLQNLTTPSVEIKENKYSPRAPLEHSTMVNADYQSRFKYYAKLNPELVPPDHVVNKSFFVPFVGEGAKQSSIVTIFSIWNTMIGSSLLTMPWAINETGWLLSIFVMLGMCAVSCYTALLILRYDQGNGLKGKVVEFAEVAYIYFGKWGSLVSLVASLGVFGGALFAYCILLASFLFDIGDTMCFWFCPKEDETNSGSNSTLTLAEESEDLPKFYDYWNPKNTAILIMLLLFPLTLVKEFGFIAKLTSVGTVSVIYMICYTVFLAADGGVKSEGTTLAGLGFYYFMGILTLSFFIHNAILNIVRNNREPKNNARDVTIAYILVCVSYMMVGFLYYFAADDKSNISDNFLNNVQEDYRGEPGLFIAQCLYFFQLATIFPLLAFVVRFQLYEYLFKNPYPSVVKVVGLHVVITGSCMLIGYMEVGISTILRYTGAIFGMIAVYLLPCGFHLQDQKRKGTLRTPSIVIHACIMVFSVGLLIAQFIPSPE